MNLSSVWTIVAALVMTGAAYGQALVPFGACAPTLPAGLLIRVAPDERIVAGQTDGPLMLTVTSDVRLFPAKPPIVPRSSKLLVRTIESKEAGRLWGRAKYQMAIDSILTPEGCQYDLDDAKLIEAGKYKIQQQAIIGKGHARRDFILWVFPPTTLYQLIRLPARGPKLVFDEESVLALRLFEPVELNEAEAIGSNLEAAPIPVPSPPVSVNIQPASAGCADKPQPHLYSPLQVSTGIIRPVRNMTTYSVTVVIGNEVISRLGPCFGSMVTVPYGEVTLTAQATILGPQGQRQIPLDVVVNAEGTGWDIVEGIHAASSVAMREPNAEH